MKIFEQNQGQRVTLCGLCGTELPHEDSFGTLTANVSFPEIKNGVCAECGVAINGVCVAVDVKIQKKEEEG